IEPRIVGHDLHAGFDRSRAGRAVDARLATLGIRDLDRADAADAGRCEAPLEVMAEDWDRDPHEPRALPARRPGADGRRPPVARPRVIDSTRSAIFCEPTRQGTHLPHDSFRKKRTKPSARSRTQVPSPIATIAPEPRIGSWGGAARPATGGRSTLVRKSIVR